jgi:hypothetical protein
MPKPLVMRSSFESMFSGIGTCSGDPFYIGSSGDEADRRAPTYAFSEAYRGEYDPSAPLDMRRSAPAKPRIRAKQDKACARRAGIRKTVAGGGAARSRAFWDMLFRKIHGGMDFRRPISACRYPPTMRRQTPGSGAQTAAESLEAAPASGTLFSSSVKRPDKRSLAHLRDAR